METLIELIGYATGVYFIKPNIGTGELVVTLIVIHLCDAVLCLIVARQGGRHQIGWTLAGLLFGVWAALPLLLQRAKPAK